MNSIYKETKAILNIFYPNQAYLLSISIVLLFLINNISLTLAQTRTIDSLTNQLNKSTTAQQQAQLYNQLSEAYKIISPAESYKKAQKALSLAQKANDKAQEANALNNLGEYHLDKGAYTRAIDFFEKALKIAKTIRNNNIKATCLNKIGVVHYLKNDYDTCLKYQLEALNILRKTKDKQKTAQVYSLVSYAYSKQGKYNQALEYHFKALALREELGEQNEIAKSFNSIGDFYQQQQNHKKAMENYTKSLEVSTKINSLKGQAISLNNLGVCYALLGEFAQAKQAHTQGLALKKQMGIPKEIAISLKNLGDVFLEEQQLDSALYFYKEAQGIQTRLQNKEALLKIDIQIAEVFIAKKNYAQAITAFEDALLQAKKINSQALIRKVYQNLYRTYALQGDAERFLTYYQAYDSLTKSTNNKLEEVNIEALKQKYEYEKKQKEYELLKKENQIKNLELKQRSILNWLLAMLVLVACLLIVVFYLRAKMRQKANKALSQINTQISALNQKLQNSEAQLQKSNKVKNKFLSIISHDLRAPLTSLLSLLQILQNAQNDEEGFPQELQQEMFMSLSKQVVANLRLLDNLLQWSKSEAEMIRFKPSNLDLKTLTENVIGILNNEITKKQIELAVELHDNIQIYADSNMLQAILLNLLNNAIKFTNTHGKITIQVDDTATDFVNIKVCDSGIGMSEEEVKQLFTSEHLSKKGTAQEKGTGLGLLLCKEFVERHKGTLTVESTLHKGSCFAFTMPRSAELLGWEQPEELQKDKSED